ncbi:hypothetical protein [Halobacterium sp. CBA1126]|uniref:WD40/YVTN/BNR-like repeat-containing protein n=1 Tax=Halobacterium sp. CBA1126 TaxID=2668074 RepID=UPI0012F8FA77|nr:hypothetical protein [Halobacterium sp. CBA1126]MUV59622.1 hypothetical protein [Halobacterium sp. CBA1126]
MAVAPLAVSHGADQQHSHGGWDGVETPTARTLHDVVHIEEGAVAVGAGGVVLDRTADDWTLVTDSGPSGNGNNLRGVAATAGGERVWVAGASGAVGEYDPASGSVTDRTAPDGVTTTFTDIAVAGPAGDATVYLVDASGHVIVSEQNGQAGTWTRATPGSGAAIAGIAASASATFLVDENDAVFKTTDGETWDELETPAFDETLTDIAMRSAETVVLAGDSGAIVVGSDGEWERGVGGGRSAP